MNTCLQCLCSIPGLNYNFKTEQYTIEKRNNTKKTNTCAAYRELILKYIANDDSFQPPNSVYRKCHDSLEPNQQHDCQEILRRILAAMTDELNKNKTYKFEDNITMEKAWSTYRAINASFIDSVFTGLMRSSVICNKCGHASYTYDPFMDLSVSIKKKRDLLEYCLERYFGKEKIDCGYKCEKCHKKTNIAIPPPVLTIQFKRFEDSGWKITSAIQFEHDLELKTYTSDSFPQLKTVYSLFAVAVHSGGSISSGHYYAYVKRDIQWYICNDSRTKRCDEEEALSKDAYLLFYRQK